MARDDFVFAVDGLTEEIDSFDQLPPDLKKWASQAINRTATHYRAEASRQIREQIAFTASYLSQDKGRLAVTETAQPSDLEAVVTGRQRPTSLARFATRDTPESSRKKGGVEVKVKPGRHTFMSGAFLMRLQAGKQLTETKHNLGLAIRLKNGERVRNKRITARRIKGSNLYLLYGPSVDQVFRSVADQEQEKAGEYMLNEFLRLSKL